MMPCAIKGCPFRRKGFILALHWYCPIHREELLIDDLRVVTSQSLNRRNP